MRRISMFDMGKGLAILGMLFAHTFEGGICQWNHEIEKNFIDNIPLALIIIFSPLTLILLMGLFFTLITSITCSLSVIQKEQFGWKAVFMYIVYRIVFAIVLKWMEIVLSSWWRQYDMFETMIIQFPIATIPRYSHTIDAIGVCGWLVPLTVYIVRKIPFVHQSNFHVLIIASLSLLLLTFYSPIAGLAMRIALYFERINWNAISLLFSKIGSGPFMLAQAVPFGLIGGAFAIIISETSTYTKLWRFDVIFSTVCIVLSLVLLFFVDDFWKAVSQENKPPSLRLLELVVEINMLVLTVYLMEDVRRPAKKRGKLIIGTTWLRRISVLSLTAFIFEEYICGMTLKLFTLIFGPAVDIVKKVYIWNFPITLFYMFFTTGVDLLIIRLWEYGSFRFSCEYFIGIVMGFLFNREGYNRIDYKKIVYQPNEEFTNINYAKHTLLRSRSKSI